MITLTRTRTLRALRAAVAEAEANVDAARERAEVLQAETARLRQELEEATARTRGARWAYVMCRDGRPVSIHGTRQAGRTAAEDSGAPCGAWKELAATAPLTPRGWDVVAVPLPPVRTDGASSR